MELFSLNIDDARKKRLSISVSDFRIPRILVCVSMVRVSTVILRMVTENAQRFAEAQELS